MYIYVYMYIYMCVCACRYICIFIYVYFMFMYKKWCVIYNKKYSFSSFLIRLRITMRPVV